MKTKILPLSRISVNYFPNDGSIKIYRNHKMECKIFGATPELAEVLKDCIKQGDYNSFSSQFGEKHVGSWLINIVSLDRNIANHFQKVVVRFSK